MSNSIPSTENLCEEEYTEADLTPAFLAMLDKGEDCIPFGLQTHLGICMSCARIWESMESGIVPEIGEAETFEQWMQARNRLRVEDLDIDLMMNAARLERVLSRSAYLLDEVLKARSPETTRRGLQGIRKDLRDHHLVVEAKGNAFLPDHLSGRVRLSSLPSREQGMFWLDRFLSASLERDICLVRPVLPDGDLELDVEQFKNSNPDYLLHRTQVILYGHAA